ncbi:MAG: hypothetical protein L0229_29440 [Blastocatellia bacterium]|nr:hypothetical protein [Blastocatellia bacterium]
MRRKMIILFAIVSAICAVRYVLLMEATDVYSPAASDSKTGMQDELKSKGASDEPLNLCHTCAEISNSADVIDPVTEDYSLWSGGSKTDWRAVFFAFVLSIMSLYSIIIMSRQWLAYSVARRDSRRFIPEFKAALRENRLEDAVKLCEQYKKSPVAVVVNGGLQKILVGQRSEEAGEKLCRGARGQRSRGAEEP